MLALADADGERYEKRRVASLATADADHILSTLAESVRLPEGQQRVEDSTDAKNRRILVAWFAWEIRREKERAEAGGRTPLFFSNPFDLQDRGDSKPVANRFKTVQEKEESRRFFSDEIASLELHGAVHLKFGMPVLHRVGLRPGEFTHLRWSIDVIPLKSGNGYEILIQGGRGPDLRCSCPSCRSRRGWAPKNGPRRNVLDRTVDEIGWIAHACDAIDAWLAMRNPKRGDYLFPSPSDPNRAMSNQELNNAVREAAKSAGIQAGMRSLGKRTAHSLRHACASELLERGVPHPLAALWIGDSLKEFMRTYGKPDAAHMARVTLSQLRK